MRVATLLLCLALAACATGGKLPGEQPTPEAAVAPGATGASAPAAAAARTPAAASRQGAQAQAQAASAPPPAAEPGPDALTQARVDCWMKVEHQKGMRNIDKRIAFVDKCVDDAVKSQAQ